MDFKERLSKLKDLLLTKKVDEVVLAEVQEQVVAEETETKLVDIDMLAEQVMAIAEEVAILMERLDKLEGVNDVVEETPAEPELSVEASEIVEETEIKASEIVEKPVEVIDFSVQLAEQKEEIEKLKNLLKEPVAEAIINDSDDKSTSKTFANKMNKKFADLRKAHNLD